MAFDVVPPARNFEISSENLQLNSTASWLDGDSSKQCYQDSSGDLQCFYYYLAST